MWPPILAPIVIPLATGIVQFATGNEELWERRSPTLSSYSHTNRLAPLAVVAVIVRHAAALEKSRLAVKADNVFQIPVTNPDRSLHLSPIARSAIESQVLER